MKISDPHRYTLIESQAHLERFCKACNNLPWLAFDTEFIPERYYRSKLCLISVTTPEGNSVIDVLKVSHLKPFIRLIENPSILKITHAGENDYRILVRDYQAKPRNIFDTQLSYGFLDYDYPMGLQLLIERVLGTRISKEELRSDWERRPLKAEQLAYAVRDVAYLHPLMEAIQERLKKEGKLEWAELENRAWEKNDAFKQDPFDFFNGFTLKNLSKRQKVFLYRLHLWRHREAEKNDRPLSGILKNRYIKSIVKNVHRGKRALFNDRTLPESMLRMYADTFLKLYDSGIKPDEEKWAGQFRAEAEDTPERRILMDILSQLIKLRAAAHSLSPSLVISKREINRMKADDDYFCGFLEEGWRKEVLGPDLLGWIKKRNPVDAEINGMTCVLTMQDRP